MKKTIAAAFVLLAFQSCSPALRHLFPLEGTWQRSTPDGIAYESWKVKSRHLMLGEGYATKGGGKQVLENLRLFVEDGKTVYEATVPDQNDGKPVHFLLTRSDPQQGLFVFENPAHDFPQRISYLLVGKDSLHVQVSASAGAPLEFGFSRSK